MTKNAVLNSIPLKKRFCKDYNIPISVFDNPYFMERLKVLDMFTTNGYIQKFDTFCSELDEFPDEQSYFEYYNSVKDSIINAIKSSPKYEMFVAANYGDTAYVASNKNLYSEANDDGIFISIDMKKANFSAMKAFSKEFFNGAECWEDYVLNFTGMNHIINSKYIRQVIFGACNPKKQIQYEHYLMNFLCGHIIDNLPGVCIYSLGPDEIIIDVGHSKEKYPMNKLREVVNDCPYGIGKLCRVQLFELYKIPGTTGYHKLYADGHSEFKCLDSDTYIQIFKYYYGMSVHADDLVFYHNGMLARYLKAVDNPWK